MSYNQKIEYTLITVLTGSDLSNRRLAYMRAVTKKNGPVIWLTGCVHGDEIGGIVIIQEIFKRLRQLPLLKGAVHALPLMNPIGFETASRHITLSEEDLNRSFPGDENGSLAQRLAQTIFTLINKTKPSLVLDLHNDWLNSIPYTLLDPYFGWKSRFAYKTAKNYSHKFGFAVINEQEEANDLIELKKTLSGSLLEQNIPALTLELGGANVVGEANVNDGVKAIWDFLVALGMAQPFKQEYNYKLPPFLKNKILSYEHALSQTSGVIRFLAKPGDIVYANQPLARVYNVFGKLQETIKAKHKSIVLGHFDYAVAFPGTDIVALGIID